MDAIQIAEEILRQHKAGERFRPMIAGHSALDISLSYDVQDHFVAALQARGEGQIAGWKVGLTTAPMQTLCQVTEPIAGPVLSGRIHHSNALISSADYGRFGLESELAIHIAKPPKGDENVAELLECIDAVCPAFELIDDRHADYTALNAASIAADNAWNRGIVLGAPMPPVTQGLLNLTGTLRINDMIFGTGKSGSVFGDPLLVVAWLARHLAARGMTLLPGAWIMTGSLVPTMFPKPGDRAKFDIETLGSVQMTIA
jgi:2-keto-4-pentenoate hydratase